MTTQLKGGYATADPRLDRIPFSDPRSLATFPIRALLTSPPRSYTFALGTTLNQGSEGACVGFGWGHELLCKPAVATGVDYRFARERIYWAAQRIDSWEGGAYPGGSPFYEGTSVLAGARVVQALGGMDEYRWAAGFDDFLAAIGYSPAVLGLNWYEGMMNVDAKGFIHPTGAVVGGHCILCRGVNLRMRRFLLHNSWGAGWGVNGTCWISFLDMERLLAESGDACFPIRRHIMAF